MYMTNFLGMGLGYSGRMCLLIYTIALLEGGGRLKEGERSKGEKGR